MFAIEWQMNEMLWMQNHTVKQKQTKKDIKSYYKTHSTLKSELSY